MGLNTNTIIPDPPKGFALDIPEPPPGFVLDTVSIPSPPSGFVLDAPGKVVPDEPTLTPGYQRGPFGTEFKPSIEKKAARETAKGMLFGEGLPEGLGYLQEPLEVAADFWSSVLMSPEEEQALMAKYPNAMAARYAAASVLLPGISEKFASPTELEEFTKKSPEEQRVEITGLAATYAAFGAGARAGGEALAALGKRYPALTEPMIKAMKESGWFNKLFNKERGLVVQSIDDMAKAGRTEGQIIRDLKKSGDRAEFEARRKTEVESAEKVRKDTRQAEAERDVTEVRKDTGRKDIQRAEEARAEARDAEEAPVVPKAKLTDVDYFHGASVKGLRGDITPSTFGDFGPGIYLSSDPQFAKAFADGIMTEGRVGKGEVVKAQFTEPKKIFSGDTPLTKDEIEHWERDGEDMRDIVTHVNLADAFGGRETPLELREASETWDRFLTKFEYDAVQSGSQLVLRDIKVLAEDIKPPAAPTETEVALEGVAGEVTKELEIFESDSTYIQTIESIPKYHVGLLDKAGQFFKEQKGENPNSKTGRWSANLLTRETAPYATGGKGGAKFGVTNRGENIHDTWAKSNELEFVKDSADAFNVNNVFHEWLHAKMKGEEAIQAESIKLTKAFFKDELTPRELREAEVAETQKKRVQKGAVTIEPVAQKFEYADATQEAAYKEYQGIQKPSLTTRAKDTLVNLKNKAAREYEHLDKNAKNAEVGFALRQLAKQKGVSTIKALRGIIEITVGLDKNTYDVFARKVILEDLLETAKENKEVPGEWMGKNQAETEDKITTELDRIDGYIETNPTIKDAVRKRQDVWNELRESYIASMEDIGFNVDQRFNRESYFRHQVLEYVESQGIFGTGKRLKTPSKRGFLKQRRGSQKAINYDYLEAEQEVMSQMYYDTEVAKTIKRIDDNYNIEKAVRKYAKENGMTFDEAVQDFDGYETWQPREGNVFYLADSIPAKLATQLYEGAMEELTITVEDLRKISAIGGKRKQFVLPTEIAQTLNELVKTKSVGEIIKFNRKVVTKWKQWQLTSPRRYLKYNIRNMTGDAEAVFVGNPSTFLKTPRASLELFDVYFRKQPLTQDMKDWFERGGTESTLQAQEMGDFYQLGEFSRLSDKPVTATGVSKRAWMGYWKAARLTTDFREAIMRYASYLDYLEQMKANPEGAPKNFGASKREEVMGLKDIKDRAFMLSNDLLGAYDRVGIAGQALRENLYPFWSWQEVNAKRYLQFAKNAAQDGDLATKAGKKILAKGLNPYTYWKLGKFAIKATAFWMMLEAYNRTMFPKEESELPEEIRSRPHIILGVDENGETRYFNRIGTLGDILEWFGLDAAPKHFSNWMDGKASLKDIGKDMAKSSVNKAVQGLYPIAKIAVEITTDTALFPSVFEPRHVKDNMEQFARNFGLDNEYRAVMGKPSRPYLETLGKLAVYKSDPLRAAYSDIYQVKKKFLKEIGKYSEGFWQTDRGDALYNFRLALKYKDEEARDRYLQEYISLYLGSGGDPNNIKTNLKASLKRMHPLSGLNEKERIVFVARLTDDDRERLVRAYQFYVETLTTGDNHAERMEQ